VVDLKPIRDSLYAAFGVERVVSAQQKHPRSSHDKNTHTLLLQCLHITRALQQVVTTTGPKKTMGKQSQDDSYKQFVKEMHY
jgi:hypothetical protein